jgi:hypothetical protein
MQRTPSSANVMTGNAFTRARRSIGAWWSDSPAREPRRLRTFSVRDDHRAVLPNASLPPVVVAVQVRVDHEVHRLLREHATAARIFGAMSANWSSMIAAPSTPTVSPMLPPRPLSM